MKKEHSIESLKKDYLKIQKKHNLPSFEKLNEDFQIERISEIETEILIREVRKTMSEKFANYLRFIETLLNPVSAPMSIFSIVKLIGTKEKEKLTEIYKNLVEMEVKVFELDVEFSEKKEAAFVKESYGSWQKMKTAFLEIIDVIKKNWNNKPEANSKGYFG